MSDHWSIHEVVIADRRDRYHAEAGIHAALRGVRKPSRTARLIRLARRRPATAPTIAPAAASAAPPTGTLPAA